MDRLALVKGLFVQQKKEWGEILTGFETRNRYAISDDNGQEILYAVEDPGNGFLRFFLKAARPFTLSVMDQNQSVILKVNRPFRFYFHRAEICDAQGNLLGVIQKKFSILRRIYVIEDCNGREIFELFGPILHPWTFEIRKDGIEYGKITKKWSGLMKEGFTDADNFGITFPQEWDVRTKSLLLGVVFLIDFVHFENKGRN